MCASSLDGTVVFASVVRQLLKVCTVNITHNITNCCADELGK